MGSDYYRAYWKDGTGGWSPRGLSVLPAEAALIREHVPPGARLLDIGCGDGRIAEEARACGARYVGVDVSSSAVEFCRAKGLEAAECNLDQPLPFPDGSFDAVTVFEVLEHLFEPARALAQIARVLKPGGAVVGSVPNIAHLPNRVLLLLGRFNPGGSPDTSFKAPWRDPHIRFFDFRATRRFFSGVPDLALQRVYGSPFDLTEWPVCYRATGRLRAALRIASRPGRFLTSARPSVFSFRIYFAARRLPAAYC